MWLLRGPVSIYLGSGAKFSPQMMFPWKVASIQTHLILFQNIFSITQQKISENWKSTDKSLKMSEIFKICTFWAISTCNTSKKTHFHIEFIFKQNKYDLFEKKEKKKQICLISFFKIDTDQLYLIVNFSNFWSEISKLSFSMPWKGFENKSHRRRAHHLKPHRNGKPIPTWGGGLKEPYWLGLNYGKLWSHKWLSV